MPKFLVCSLIYGGRHHNCFNFNFRRAMHGEKLDFSYEDWLRHSSWDPYHDNVVLVHGYAGGDNTFPMSMLRDGKIT